MKNLGAMMKSAQQMQDKMKSLQDELTTVEVTGTAGGGMVEVTLSGKHETRAVKIDPSLIVADEAAVLEDLIAAAFNDAKNKVETVMQEKMSELTGGLQLPPGMTLPF
ncbi:MAG: YbaB/EbfC family nucleoid-associated protein [Rhodospirillaceae bacterium]|jgi:nucleoid-associated protein EbfC|nr:YbaB/EbfC family nucleoid-associated protein [Rhodospirillaceae bacterium]MBT5244921.1 YbaB/EbfC family nucleoid-associated protein [Rhodospirillaceae bacterium]MBT5562688.1 YbaB/EbfC family nucleoid-associated protein [Rhodospirillaceae bacterium]MBT6243002.1 YbaB/EbfC family nucleoid-associated protein [Rhodospirillaceae bacterium]MBT7136849.1 YbaB/EbfC family nucleoid-associated protein [Rhodospirillaceae bacterium]